MDLGAGPLNVSLLTPTQGVYLIVADAQPSASVLGEPFAAGETIVTARPFNVASHVWARAMFPAGSSVAVTALNGPGSSAGSPMPVQGVVGVNKLSRCFKARCVDGHDIPHIT